MINILNMPKWDKRTVPLSQILLLLLVLVTSCREEETIFLPEHVSVAQP